MVARRTADRLRHMLDAAIAAERLTAGKSIEAYRAQPDLAAATEAMLAALGRRER